MKTDTIFSYNDPRLCLYKDIKEKRLYKEHQLFLVEGKHLVKRVVQSDFEVHSVLSTPERAIGLDFIPSQIKVYLVSEALISRVVGFKFHRGVLALGKRKADIFLQQWKAPLYRLVVCPEINDVENLGVIIRNAAAFGVDALLIGPKCADPFSRRSLRASMGAVFKLPIIRSADLFRDIGDLKSRGIAILGSVIAEDAAPLDGLSVPEKWALLLGNEAQGLGQQWLAQCDRKVMISINSDIDSLNVAVASGIFMFYLQKESC